MRVAAEVVPTDDAGRDATHEVVAVASDLEVDGQASPRPAAP